MHVIRRRTRIEIWTSAKLNLYLELHGRRNDGFHELSTLMMPVGWYDTISFSSPTDASSVSVTCRWASGTSSANRSKLPPEQDNLVFKALQQLQLQSGCQRGIHADIVKRIPSEAGMGGASSDAAAALLAANELWDLRWSHSRLSELAAQLGSDVPFFLDSTTALCEGRGEIIKRAPAAHLHFVIAKPPVGLSTKLVYQNTSVPTQDIRSPAPLVSALRRKCAVSIGRNLFNRLQEAATGLTPWVNRLKFEFDRLNMLGHQMSGSGTSYFGICRNAREARRSASILRGRRIGQVVSVGSVCMPTGLTRTA